MANFDEQLLQAWNEWEEITGAAANDPDDFITWAVENRRLAPRPQDVRKFLRRQVSRVLRQATRMDEAGFAYRAKQSVLSLEEDGKQHRFWFDTDKGGTPNLRQKAVRQRRDGIASDVYRAVCDMEHMNKVFPEDPQLTFFMDFADDVAERRAADLLNRDSEDDQDEAA
ncbi:hypothetical protein XI06_15550 [Bradyrhizobium sp. CCBAU 11434]|uniref:hypothetical protein n=1 Tax=Bradyrhizobium sp. CCBAU 11434 TaxID=1630885 RepID=UPI002306A3E3|nr:hypothetical protein [Bradyrhizobium sp. CCBAU 11434]MDA9521705.1 hypothetical protein [Bradyrhizobium sp. CCBAU 11434]